MLTQNVLCHVTKTITQCGRFSEALPIINQSIESTLSSASMSAYFFNKIDELSLLIQQVYFLMKQTLYYIMKVYHLVSQQDSSSPRASLCPFASEKGTGILATPSVVYFNCFIYTDINI